MLSSKVKGKNDEKQIDCRKQVENGDDVERPEMFNNMKSLVELFAQDFRYVRVDLYCLGIEVYFGELTFHSTAGFQQFIPQKWDRIFGDKLIL